MFYLLQFISSFLCFAGPRLLLCSPCWNLSYWNPTNGVQGIYIRLAGKTHIVGKYFISHMWLVGCPNPSKIEQCWECTFLNLIPIWRQSEHQNFFHFCPLEIAATVHGWDGPSRLDWPCTLAAISEGQKWNCVLMLILSSHK